MEAKQGKWNKGFVDEAREHIVIVTTNSQRRRHKLRIAFDDIRLVPSSELLYELEQLELRIGTGYTERNGYRSIGHGFQL